METDSRQDDSWCGPPVQVQSRRLITPPDNAKWPRIVPHLGDVRYRVILTTANDERHRHFDGLLRDFFPTIFNPSGEPDLAAIERENFKPANFGSYWFREAVVEELSLHEMNWVLWMALGRDLPCIKIANDDASLKDAMEIYQTQYLDECPTGHYVIYFLVQVEDQDHRYIFSRLAPPHRLPRCDPEDSPTTEPSPPVSANHPLDAASQCSPEGESSSFEQIPISALQSLHFDSEPSSDGDGEEEEDKVGVLAAIDTDYARNGDVMDGDLEAVLPVTGSPSEAEWIECCSLLLLDSTEHTNPTNKSVLIPHTGISITPRQYRTAFWMLTCRVGRDIGGGVLADVPGTGKTHTCVALMLLRALIAYNMAEVKREWQQRKWEAEKGKSTKPRPLTHLPEGAAGDKPCPCGNALGVLCYANPQGITRFIGERMARGVSLINVPQGVIEEWKIVLSSGRLNRRFFEPAIIHSDAPRDLQPPPNFSKKFDITARPLAKSYSKDHILKVTDVELTYRIEQDPGKQPERFIIVTTHQTERLRLVFQQYNVNVQITGKGKDRKLVYGLPVGCQLVDEFHKVRNMSSAVVKSAEEQKYISQGKFDFWVVTGTPVPNGSLMDLDTTISILERDEWSVERHPQHKSRIEALVNLDQAYRAAVAATGSQSAVEDFKRMADEFFNGLVIRHTMESRFFDQRITTIKEHKPRKRTLLTPPQYREDVQLLANQVRDRIRAITQSDSYEQVVRSMDTWRELVPLQVVSTFPAAASLILQGRITFKTADLKAAIKELKDRQDVANVKQFADLVDAVIQDSKKLGAIILLIEHMLQNTQRRPKTNAAGKEYGPRDNRALKKLVVVTPTLGEAIFLYLGLKKTLVDLPIGKGIKTVLLHADLKSSEKQSMLKDFQSLVNGSATVLVTPYAVGGTGLNLQTANYQALTGPLRTKNYELQAFARTNREGNALKLYHWLALTDDNPADRLIIARQANATILTDPFDMSVELELEQVERQDDIDLS